MVTYPEKTPLVPALAFEKRLNLLHAVKRFRRFAHSQEVINQIDEGVCFRLRGLRLPRCFDAQLVELHGPCDIAHFAPQPANSIRNAGQRDLVSVSLSEFERFRQSLQSAAEVAAIGAAQP